MRTPSIISIARPVVAVLALAALASGCKKTAATEPVVAAALTVVQGDNQAVQAGKDLPNPIVLRVTNKTGGAMASVPVTLVVAEGGGTVTPASGTTDSKGEYSARWTLGTTSLNQIRATVPGLDPIKIYATGILPSDLIIAQGNWQTAKAGAALTTSIIVRVVGAGNVPLIGIPVLFQITGGGGAISPATGVTNALGEVTGKWTLGSFVGTQYALVTASTLTPVTLTANATP